MKALVLIISSLTVVSCTSGTLSNKNASSDTTPSMVRILESDSGSFRKTALIYNALTPDELFMAEYDFISKHYGQRGKDWFLMTQTIIRENEKIIDVVEIREKKRVNQRVIFFDVTDVYIPKKDTMVRLVVKHN